MSVKSGLCRLAFSWLDRSLSRKGISSLSARCSMAVPKLPPVAVTNFLLRAPERRSFLVDPPLPSNIAPRSILDLPLGGMNRIIEAPPLPTMPTTIPTTNPVAIEDPTVIIEQQAARLIVIRRAKMRRHKLKKLRIKMKFYWAKLRQKRELRKEKAFQSELMGKIKEAEKFDAAAYASSKIQSANEVLIPKLWKGKRLPEFLIRQLIDEKNERHREYCERQDRRKRMVKYVADYKV